MLKVKNIGSIHDPASYKGQTVSLNQKKTSFWGLGPRDDRGTIKKVWLSYKEWHTKLPGDLTRIEIDEVTNAINSGIIVWGKKWLPKFSKDETVLQKYVNLMKVKLNSESKKPFVQLVRSEQEGYYTALEVLSYCLKKERDLNNRVEWITFLKDGIGSYIGPVTLVEDFPEDAYEVTIDHQGIVTDDSRKVILDDVPEDYKIRIPRVRGERSLSNIKNALE